MRTTELAYETAKRTGITKRFAWETELSALAKVRIQLPPPLDLVSA